MARTETDVASTADPISLETEAGSPLYFFPGHEISATELRQILDTNDDEQRSWAVSNMLRYAQWEDIWTFVSRDEVRDMFSSLDLPDNLRAAYARMLKVEAVV